MCVSHLMYVYVAVCELRKGSKLAAIYRSEQEIFDYVAVRIIHYTNKLQNIV